MIWSKQIFGKRKLALVLTIIMALVFIKNLVDQNNASELDSSISSFYEDRLLVESYIFQMSDHLHNKKWAFDNCREGRTYFNAKSEVSYHDEKIHDLLASYESTHLTELEAIYFKRLKENIEKIEQSEQEFLFNPNQTAHFDELSIKAAHDGLLMHALHDLKNLSKIQVSEGKNISDNSKRIIHGSTLLTQFELGLLIVLGLVVQILIFSPPQVMTQFPQNPRLN